MNIGKLISDRRKVLNLTLEQVGNYVGVSKSTVKKWEDGYISNMKRDKISLLSKVLQINPVSLITGELVENNCINNDNSESIVLTYHEEKLVTAYRNKPEMQTSVDKLLDIDSVNRSDSWGNSVKEDITREISYPNRVNIK